MEHPVEEIIGWINESSGAVPLWSVAPGDYRTHATVDDLASWLGDNLDYDAIRGVPGDYEAVINAGYDAGRGATIREALIDAVRKVAERNAARQNGV